ncbi:hypothetical protein KS4_15020 [Poriferisphaera corsica]|uniref:Flavinylation-associated cytochrome domain-containing protein n=1 Tax=Poriferisphaera corsica TaxID=2528020 RepID=A0A517YTB5_9BACT|nr:DUF4405 domain-containing protein [Poriferisphaera corsica]QDU33454.1 hypothetical protein KS4_15020 [Poriferisphaera corsica]
MKRNHINLILDITLGLILYIILLTGLIMYYILPPGSRSSTVWGWTRHDLGSLHFYLGIAAIAIILIHLALHWQWVHTLISNLLGRKHGQKIGRAKYASGVIVLFVFTTLTIAVLIFAANAKISSRKHATSSQQAKIQQIDNRSQPPNQQQQLRLRSQ